jgi:hypothetical protein
MINNEIKQRIKNILETNRSARDCDRLLISIMWKIDFEHLYGKLELNDAKGLLIALENGELTSTETIRRCRQHLQQNDESLRGLKYRERQRLGEEVRQTISK